MLQWSPGNSAGDTSPGSNWTLTRREGFNGAPAIQPGILLRTNNTSGGGVALQWSPGNSAGDTKARSMACSTSSSFNGAPAIQPGIPRDRQAVARSNSRLQWSPGNSAGDTCANATDAGIDYVRLQWSPGNSAGDTPHSAAASPAPRRRFNGAPAIQPGIPSAAAREGDRSWPLQWSPGNSAGDTLNPWALAARCRAGLQWSPGNSAGDTGKPLMIPYSAPVLQWSPGNSAGDTAPTWNPCATWPPGPVFERVPKCPETHSKSRKISRHESSQTRSTSHLRAPSRSRHTTTPLANHHTTTAARCISRSARPNVSTTFPPLPSDGPRLTIRTWSSSCLINPVRSPTMSTRCLAERSHKKTEYCTGSP